MLYLKNRTDAVPYVVLHIQDAKMGNGVLITTMQREKFAVFFVLDVTQH